MAGLAACIVVSPDLSLMEQPARSLASCRWGEVLRLVLYLQSAQTRIPQHSWPMMMQRLMAKVRYQVPHWLRSWWSGVGRTLGYTATSVGEVFNGLANNDLEMAGRGAKKVAKVIAVGTLAVGIGDILILGDTIIPDVEIVNEFLVMEAEIFNNPSDMSEMDVVLYEDVSEVNSLEEVSNFTNDVDYVQPHWVSGYERNGTYIEGYWRDGDGNTSENLTSEQGGGYFRSNSST